MSENNEQNPIQDNAVAGQETVEEGGGGKTVTPLDVSSLTQEQKEALAAEINKKIAEQRNYSNLKEFDNDFLQVYFTEPFLSSISLEITKKPEFGIETAAVGFDPHLHDLMLLYNPDFMRGMTETHRRGVIRHELYHVVFQHLTERMPADKELAVAWNVATDMAINSIIGEQNLPDLAIIPGKEIKPRKDASNLDKKFGAFVKSAPLMQASEYYFEQIKQLIDEDKKEGGDGTINVGGGFDSHDMWGKLPEHVKDLIKEKMRNLVERAARTAEQNNQWGSVPVEIQERIRKMLSKEVDWRSVLRNFFGRCRSQERISTIKRINKKVPYVYPGVKRNTVANFACFIDQSGSVGDEDLCLFFGELESFAEHTELDVYHFDTEVDEKSHRKWKKGFKAEPRRTRSGGTDFSCVQKFCNNRINRGRWSGILILTDGFADTMGQIVGTKVLWVITPSGTVSAARKGDYVIQMHRDKQMRNALLNIDDDFFKKE